MWVSVTVTGGVRDSALAGNFLLVMESVAPVIMSVVASDLSV